MNRKIVIDSFVGINFPSECLLLQEKDGKGDLQCLDVFLQARIGREISQLIRGENLIRLKNLAYLLVGHRVLDKWMNIGHVKFILRKI